MIGLDQLHTQDDLTDSGLEMKAPTQHKTKLPLAKKAIDKTGHELRHCSRTNERRAVIAMKKGGVASNDFIVAEESINGICKGSVGLINDIDKHGVNVLFVGKGRDWICDSCNTGLGRFKDDIQFFERIIKYLEKFA